MSTLTLERRAQPDETLTVGRLVMTPPVDEGYWAYRVRLGESQAVVGFPKFATVGIGFAREKDWNTNLPYTCGAEEIYQHIAHNKGDDSVSREDCVEAIRMVQEAVAQDRAGAR